MLVDGNDDRGIDVGVMAAGPAARSSTSAPTSSTATREGVVFSRDCCEYHVRMPDGGALAVLVNHFKSKGYSEPGDRLGAGRRRRQAGARRARSTAGCAPSGVDLVAVVGEQLDPSRHAPSPILSFGDGPIGP